MVKILIEANSVTHICVWDFIAETSLKQKEKTEHYFRTKQQQAEWAFKFSETWHAQQSVYLPKTQIVVHLSAST